MYIWMVAAITIKRLYLGTNGRKRKIKKFHKKLASLAAASRASNFRLIVPYCDACKGLLMLSCIWECNGDWPPEGPIIDTASGCCCWCWRNGPFPLALPTGEADVFITPPPGDNSGSNPEVDEIWLTLPGDSRGACVIIIDFVPSAWEDDDAARAETVDVGENAPNPALPEIGRMFEGPAPGEEIGGARGLRASMYPDPVTADGGAEVDAEAYNDAVPWKVLRWLGGIGPEEAGPCILLATEAARPLLTACCVWMCGSGFLEETTDAEGCNGGPWGCWGWLWEIVQLPVDFCGGVKGRTAGTVGATVWLGGGAGFAASLKSVRSDSSSRSNCFSYKIDERAFSMSATRISSWANLECLRRPRWRFCEMPSTRLASVSSNFVASSKSSNASSTFSPRMFELAFNRSIWRRLLIVLFTATWCSSKTDARWRSVSYPQLSASSSRRMWMIRLTLADLAFKPWYPNESPSTTHSLIACLIFLVQENDQAPQVFTCAWSKSAKLCQALPNFLNAFASGGWLSVVETLTSLLPISAWATESAVINAEWHQLVNYQWEKTKQDTHTSELWRDDQCCGLHRSIALQAWLIRIAPVEDLRPRLAHRVWGDWNQSWFYAADAE